MAELPTFDEVVGPAKAEQLPTFDEVINKPVNTISDGSVSGYFGHLGKTFMDEWGPQPIGLSEQSTKELKRLGVFNDYEHARIGEYNAMAEGLLRPAAAALDIFMRGTTAAFKTGQEAVTELGRIGQQTEIGRALNVQGLARDIAAYPESVFGTPFTRAPSKWGWTQDAKDLNVVGAGEAGWKGYPVQAELMREPPPFQKSITISTPEGEIIGSGAEPIPSPRRGATLFPAEETPPTAPADIHAAAREAAPETFQAYDDLAQQRDTFRAQRAELEAEKAPPEDIARVNERVAEVESLLRELSPNVRDAYGKAYEAAPPPTEADRGSLRALIDNGAPSAEIEKNPVVEKAHADSLAIPRTDKAPNYGTPEYQASRVFNFKGADGAIEQVTGYENAIPRLIENAKALGGGDIAHDRTVTIVIGPPAAGKSFFAEQKLARQAKAAVVDVDEAKKVMPEFGGGIGANAVHEESTALTKPVLQSLLQEGANIVYPRVGANFGKLVQEIAGFRNAGYKVNLVNISVQPEEAYRRMIRRFMKTGRLIDRTYFFDEVDGNPDRTYNRVKNEGLVDQAVQIDANGPPGKEKITDGADTALARYFAADRNGGGNAPSVLGGVDRREPAVAPSAEQRNAPLLGEQPAGIPPHRVTAADGTAIEVVPIIVEAKDLKTSADAGYDASLQPRNRDRAASQAQIRDISSNLDPERLGYSSEADRGAPIVGPDGNIESGNGRVLALRQVYAQENSTAAQRYRQWLASQGVDVTKYNEPILVRQRVTELTPEQRRHFTVAANQAATLTMSAPERAAADASKISSDMLGLLRNPDDLGAIANRDFTRAFLQKLPQTEQGAMVNAEGGLSAEGLTRIRNAALSKAYGDSDILARIAESTNDEIKSISNALVSAAPEWAKLKGDIEAGRVRADVDLTPSLMEAVKRTADIRSKGMRLESYLAQQDAFDRVSGPVETFMRMFYDNKGRRAAASQKIADSLKFYATEARKVSAEAGLDMGLAPVKASDILKLAAEKQGTPFVEGQQGLFEPRQESPALAPELKPAQETSPGIAKSASQAFLATGRPQAEADALGAVMAAYFETRADRFHGAKGSALELYNKEGPKILAAEKGGPKGEAGGKTVWKGIQAAITIFKSKADASTAIHEIGHTWLADLLRDAKDAKAPPELKADAQAVLKWLGVEKAEDIKPRHEEKFARGTEAYFMEGRAPNKQLTDVFTQFRDWLLKIYQSAKALKVELTPEIRDVFDRLIAKAPDRPAIAPEREPQSLAVRHEAAVESTTPRETAVTLQAERDRAALTLPLEVQYARFEGVESGARRREAGGAQPNGPGNVAEPVDQGRGAGQATGTLGEGRGQAPAQGAGASEKVTQPFQLLPEPETKFIDKAGNIRIDNLNTPDDVSAVIRDAAQRNGGFLDARRGVLSDAEVINLADALGMDAKDLNRRKIGEAFNAEQIVAARQLLIDSATKVRDAMAQAAQGDDAAVLAYAEAKQRHLMIHEQVSGITAEAGRALRAFRAMAGMREAQAVSNFVAEATGKTLFQLRREAQLGMNLPTPAQVSKFVKDSVKPTWKDKLVELWINLILSGPKTQVTNALSNTLVALYTVPETAIAGAIGKGAELLGKDRGVYAGEAAARLWGMIQGSKDGIRAGLEIFKNEELLTAQSKLEGRRPAIGGVVGQIVRIPGRTLTAVDQVYKTIANRMELNALAYREAAKEGLEPTAPAFAGRMAELIENPTGEMVNAAKKNEDYQTFNNKLGKVGSAVMHFANSHPLLRFIIPFVRTPVNIVKFAAERSPAGLFFQEVRDNLAGKNGAAARDTQAARLVLGTAVSATAMSMALEGLISGNGPSDPGERAVLRQTGWQPYSVKIGDHWYSYARMEPLGTLLGIAADLADAKQAVSDDEIEKAGKLMLVSVMKNITSKTFLQGISELANVAADSDRYGDRYIQRFVASFVPNALAQVIMADDPYLREARTVVDAIKARVPGLRGQLLPKRDIWGEPIRLEGSVGPDALSPITQSTANNDPVNLAMLRLGYHPGKLARKIRGVDLTDQQYDDFARIAGRTAKMQLDQIVNSPGFDAAPAYVQHELMKKTVDHAREATRALIMMQHPDIPRQALQDKRDLILGR